MLALQRRRVLSLLRSPRQVPYRLPVQCPSLSLLLCASQTRSDGLCVKNVYAVRGGHALWSPGNCYEQYYHDKNVIRASHVFHDPICPAHHIACLHRLEVAFRSTVVRILYGRRVFVRGCMGWRLVDTHGNTGNPSQDADAAAKGRRQDCDGERHWIMTRSGA